MEEVIIKIFFTADQHFGHINIIRHCSRPFSSVIEMDKSLLENWNSCVGQNCTVYIIGDLFFRNTVPAHEYLLKINGKKHLIIGNHDKDWMKRIDLFDFFETVSYMAEISDGSHRITLCHYPLMTWDGCGKGTYMIHGHCHNSIDTMYFSLLQIMPDILNAAVEINGYQPVTFDELKYNNALFKQNPW